MLSELLSDEWQDFYRRLFEMIKERAPSPHEPPLSLLMYGPGAEAGLSVLVASAVRKGMVNPAAAPIRISGLTGRVTVGDDPTLSVSLDAGVESIAKAVSRMPRRLILLDHIDHSDRHSLRLVEAIATGSLQVGGYPVPLGACVVLAATRRPAAELVSFPLGQRLAEIMRSLAVPQLGLIKQEVDLAVVAFIGRASEFGVDVTEVDPYVFRHVYQRLAKGGSVDAIEQEIGWTIGSQALDLKIAKVTRARLVIRGGILGRFLGGIAKPVLIAEA